MTIDRIRLRARQLNRAWKHAYNTRNRYLSRLFGTERLALNRELDRLTRSRP